MDKGHGEDTSFSGAYQIILPYLPTLLHIDLATGK